MDEKDKDLLLNDICGRLLYGVKTSYSGHEMTIRGVDVESKTVDVIDWGKARFAAVRIEKIKPYLRPMSSMTEEEKKEYGKVCDLDTEILANHPMNGEPFPALYNSQDWLNKNMFDYRGLIPKGFAIEAPEGMYNN